LFLFKTEGLVFGINSHSELDGITEGVLNHTQACITIGNKLEQDKQNPAFLFSEATPTF
jgi:hypothetical protein